MNAIIRGHRCPKCSPVGEVFIVSGEDGECPIQAADEDMKLALRVWNAWKYDVIKLEGLAGWLVEAVMWAENIVKEYQAEEVKRGKS